MLYYIIILNYYFFIVLMFPSKICITILHKISKRKAALKNAFFNIFMKYN